MDGFLTARRSGSNSLLPTFIEAAFFCFSSAPLDISPRFHQFHCFAFINSIVLLIPLQHLHQPHSHHFDCGGLPVHHHPSIQLLM